MNTRHYGRVAGVIVAAACLFAPATAAAASPLRGWWPMNERSGQTVYDWSGNRNNGQLGSTAGVDDNDPSWIKGIFNVGSALRFDGDDFVTIPDSPSLRPEKLTVSAWVRTEQTPPAFKYIVAKGSDQCFGSSFALYTTENSLLSFYVYQGDNHWVRSPEATDVVWDGRWHHIAGTYDGQTVRLFVDGRQVGNGTTAGGAIDYDLPTPDMVVGSYQGSCSMYLIGDVDGVSIWDRALPISQIGDLVRSLLGGR
jgi:hypothetical protein